MKKLNIKSLRGFQGCGVWCAASVIRTAYRNRNGPSKQSYYFGVRLVRGKK